MSISAKTNWEVRTTGASTGGGGFVATPYTSKPVDAPTVAMGGNNSVALDVYYIVVTYVDAYGETAMSPEASLDVNNAETDTIVVTSPPAVTNALSYNVYIGTVSGGPYYYQANTAIGTNYSRTTTPATSGDQPSGTDYSQQDAAEDSGTDLACADGDAYTLNSAPVVTSASHNFVPADVGNIINITEAGTGFTLGRYEIIGVDGSGGAILDRAVGADGALANGDWYLGGAVDHPNTISTAVVATNRVHIKSGTYQAVGANDYVLTCSVTGGIFTIEWIGYKTSRLDAPTGTDRPLFDGNSASTNCVVIGSTTDNLFSYIRFASATAANITMAAGRVRLYNCKVSGAGTDGLANTSSYGTAVLYSTEVSNNGDAGNDSAMHFWSDGSYIHDNTGEGHSSGANGSQVRCLNTIFESNGGHGCLCGSGSINCFENNIAYNNTGSNVDGFSLGGTGGGGTNSTYLICNNISKDNSRYGFTFSLVNSAFWAYPFLNNCSHGNGTAAYYNVLLLGSSNLTSDPLFTDAANGDFSLQSGSPCIDAGFPSTPMAGATI